MGIIKTIIVGGEGLTEKQEKIRKLFMYLVSGGITTVANWVVYIIVDLAVKNDMMMSVFGFEFTLKYGLKQIIGWIVAVIVGSPVLGVYSFLRSSCVSPSSTTWMVSGMVLTRLYPSTSTSFSVTE